MNATGLDLGGCPGVARADADARAGAGRLLASLPDGWEVELPPLGAVNLLPVGVGDVPPDAIALGIRREGATARLCLPSALAARLVDRAISAGELFAPARALGPAERGVLLALLAPLLDPIGWSFVLGPAAGGAGPAVVLRVMGAVGAGTMWLQAEPPTGGARAVDAARAARLAVEARVQLAATTLARGALTDVAAGDVVVFDGVAHPDAGERGCRVELVVGAFRAVATIDPDGLATIGGRWRREKRKDVNMGADDTIDSAAEALAAAPVEVVAEFGRITLRGDEVLGLAPGVVLGLRVDRTSAVSLRVGGAIWAEGELVNVEGELGVRVTRVLAR